MKVLILGSGLLGITSAYVLASRGHSVEVVDRRDACGAETSFANGGQLSYSHAEPWASPHVLRKLPKWLLHADSPLIFRPRADMAMVRWGLRFLENCTTARAEKNCINMLRLGMYSREKMQRLVKDTGLDFDYREKGILHFFSTESELRHAERQVEFQAKFGCEERMLSAEEVVKIEPALAHTERTIVGGVFSGMDASGDAQKFCVEMAKYCENTLGVQVHCGTMVQKMEMDGDAITSVATSKGVMQADAYVMALGSYSPLLLAPLGIHVPIYPMKGYSITIAASAQAPEISITDGTNKIVFSRLGDRLRVAGTAEFAGYDDALREQRLAPIVRASKSLFPQEDWSKRTHEWACLRPSTPDGPPMLGPTPYRNLFLNTGHGTLGWTQAAGSAHIITDIMEKRTPEITLGGLTLRQL